MKGKARKDNLEISSDQLKAELVEIKERIGSLETIATISNRTEVERHVKAHIKSDQARQIMKECQEPRTKQQLMSKLGFNSTQALDYHLTPLRENNLIHQRFDEEGSLQTFECSQLFRQLPKRTQTAILSNSE